jgi:uracil-DNA glycosylase
MAEKKLPDPGELARITLQHLDCLRAAGVEWVPSAKPLPVPVAVSMLSGSVAPAKANFNLTNNTNYPETPESMKPTNEGSQPLNDSPMSRRRQLELLASTVSKCPRCPELMSTRTQTVFGVGQIDPELCFIGEAPGADEDARGEPFVGAAGQLLNRIIEACGMKREEVYICNILKCRPPGNRLPLPQEAANCREYLEKQLTWLRPKFICTLGACASQNLLGSTETIGRLRGRFHQYQGIPVLCTYHPAYLLRSPDKKKDVWEDMKKLLKEMGRAIPQKDAPRS